jgi:hypothetical protein
MATSANGKGRHPELVESPRERRPFTQLEPGRPQGGGSLSAEAARGLPRLRLRVEPQVPALVRGLVTIAAHAASFAEDSATQVSSLNRRRRAATEWVRAILDGAIDASTLRDVADVWLPALIGGSPDIVRLRAPICIEYVRGVMTALVLARPEDNLVPEARSLHALETVLAVHLGAAVGRALPAAPRAATRAPASAPKVTV